MLFQENTKNSFLFQTRLEGKKVCAENANNEPTQPLCSVENFKEGFLNRGLPSAVASDAQSFSVAGDTSFIVWEVLIITHKQWCTNMKGNCVRSACSMNVFGCLVDKINSEDGQMPRVDQFESIVKGVIPDRDVLHRQLLYSTVIDNSYAGRRNLGRESSLCSGPLPTSILSRVVTKELQLILSQIQTPAFRPSAIILRFFSDKFLVEYPFWDKPNGQDSQAFDIDAINDAEESTCHCYMAAEEEAVSVFTAHSRRFDAQWAQTTQLADKDAGEEGSQRIIALSYHALLSGHVPSADARNFVRSVSRWAEEDRKMFLDVSTRSFISTSSSPFSAARVALEKQLIALGATHPLLSAMRMKKYDVPAAATREDSMHSAGNDSLEDSPTALAGGVAEEMAKATVVGAFTIPPDFSRANTGGAPNLYPHVVVLQRPAIPAGRALETDSEGEEEFCDNHDVVQHDKLDRAAKRGNPGGIARDVQHMREKQRVPRPLPIGIEFHLHSSFCDALYAYNQILAQLEDVSALKQNFKSGEAETNTTSTTKRTVIDNTRADTIGGFCSRYSDLLFATGNKENDGKGMNLLAAGSSVVDLPQNGGEEVFVQFGHAESANQKDVNAAIIAFRDIHGVDCGRSKEASAWRHGFLVPEQGRVGVGKKLIAPVGTGSAFSGGGEAPLVLDTSAGAKQTSLMAIPVPRCICTLAAPLTEAARAENKKNAALRRRVPGLGADSDEDDDENEKMRNAALISLPCVTDDALRSVICAVQYFINELVIPLRLASGDDQISIQSTSLYPNTPVPLLAPSPSHEGVLTAPTYAVNWRRFALFPVYQDSDADGMQLTKRLASKILNAKLPTSVDLCAFLKAPPPPLSCPQKNKGSCTAEVLQCARCGRYREYGINRCARCRCVSYCSRKHQIDDWKGSGSHKLECDLLSKHAGHTDSVTILTELADEGRTIYPIRQFIKNKEEKDKKSEMSKEIELAYPTIEPEGVTVLSLLRDACALSQKDGMDRTSQLFFSPRAISHITALSNARTFIAAFSAAYSWYLHNTIPSTVQENGQRTLEPFVVHVLHMQDVFLFLRYLAIELGNATKCLTEGLALQRPYETFLDILSTSQVRVLLVNNGGVTLEEQNKVFFFNPSCDEEFQLAPSTGVLGDGWHVLGKSGATAAAAPLIFRLYHERYHNFVASNAITNIDLVSDPKQQKNTSAQPLRPNAIISLRNLDFSSSCFATDTHGLGDGAFTFLNSATSAVADSYFSTMHNLPARTGSGVPKLAIGIPIVVVESSYGMLIRSVLALQTRATGNAGTELVNIPASGGRGVSTTLQRTKVFSKAVQAALSGMSTTPKSSCTGVAHTSVAEDTMPVLNSFGAAPMPPIISFASNEDNFNELEQVEFNPLNIYFQDCIVSEMKQKTMPLFMNAYCAMIKPAVVS